MDDNKILTLASNERIPLLAHMRLIFVCVCTCWKLLEIILSGQHNSLILRYIWLVSWWDVNFSSDSYRRFVTFSLHHLLQCLVQVLSSLAMADNGLHTRQAGFSQWHIWPRPLNKPYRNCLKSTWLVTKSISAVVIMIIMGCLTIVDIFNPLLITFARISSRSCLY